MITEHEIKIASGVMSKDIENRNRITSDALGPYVMTSQDQATALRAYVAEHGRADTLRTVYRDNRGNIIADGIPAQEETFEQYRARLDFWSASQGVH